MNKKKNLLAGLLAAVLSFTVAAPAFAAKSVSELKQEMAETEEQRKKLDELIDMMGLCQSVSELTGVANKVAEMGVIPDADKKAATKIYHDNKARILSAAVADEEIPL